MSKKQEEIPQILDISDEQIADGIITFIPKFISFLLVIAGGFLLLSPLELYFETWLSQYVKTPLIVTGIVLIIAFGPLFYIEEKLEKVISVILAKIMKRKLAETKVGALEDMSKIKR